MANGQQDKATGTGTQASASAKRVVKSKDLAKRIMVVTSDFRSWTDASGKELDEAGLKAAGLATSDLVAVPFFSTEDMASVEAFGAALPRVIGEWQKAKQFTHVATDNPAAIAANGGSPELRLADATLEENPIIFITDALKSGVRLGHQQVMGQALRKAAEAKLGKPGTKGTGRRSRDIDA